MAHASPAPGARRPGRRGAGRPAHRARARPLAGGGRRRRAARAARARPRRGRRPPGRDRARPGRVVARPARAVRQGAGRPAVRQGPPRADRAVHRRVLTDVPGRGAGPRAGPRAGLRAGRRACPRVCSGTRGGSTGRAGLGDPRTDRRGVRRPGRPDLDGGAEPGLRRRAVRPRPTGQAARRPSHRHPRPRSGPARPAVPLARAAGGEAVQRASDPAHRDLRHRGPEGPLRRGGRVARTRTALAGGARLAVRARHAPRISPLRRLARGRRHRGPAGADAQPDRLAERPRPSPGRWR